jgi:gamma-glutamylcyclotransferase (GGCT)/AIG2-like uncharacterized protein YtfP
MAASLMHNLFVYGTLKAGFPLHNVLSSASFVTKCRTSGATQWWWRALGMPP